jgi:branched-chain amino acid transport system ATP-binding protein
MSGLYLRNVSKRFGGLHAVSDVNLAVPAGSIVGLIGPNGAGKTTLVNLITGILKLDAGEILLDGQDLTTASMIRIAHAGINRTFQTIRLLPDASVMENIVLGFHRHEKSSLVASMLGLPSARTEGRDLRTRAGELLSRFNMSRYAEYPAATLSYGHQRRVEIMRALAAEPRILLLDEPVAGMNDVEAGEIGEICESLALSGIGILLIEHNMRFVTALSATVHVLDAGRMIASGSPQAVMRNPTVIEAYLGT